MPYDRFEKRLQKLERPHRGIKIVAVQLYGEDDEEPPDAPGIELIEITLGNPSEQGEAAGS